MHIKNKTIRFLPSTTKFMEDILDEIIEESSYSSYERVIEPVGKEDYLLKNAGSVTELCIKSKEEFRLFLELKRLYNEISIEGNNIICAESGVKAFNLEGINIVVNDEGIMSIVDENVIKVSKEDFIRKPIKSIKELLRK